MSLTILFIFVSFALAQKPTHTTCFQNNNCLNDMTNGVCSLKLVNGFLKLYGTASGDSMTLWKSANSKTGKGPFSHRIRADGFYGIYDDSTKNMIWNTNIKSTQGVNVAYQLDLNEIKTSRQIPTGCSLELKQMSVNGGVKTFVKNIWSLSKTITYTEEQCLRLSLCNGPDLNGLPNECACVCNPKCVKST